MKCGPFHLSLEDRKVTRPRVGANPKCTRRQTIPHAKRGTMPHIRY